MPFPIIRNTLYGQSKPFEVTKMLRRLFQHSLNARNNLKTEFQKTNNQEFLSHYLNELNGLSSAW